MTHEDAGHYGAKHPAGTSYEPRIAAAIREKAENDKITCAAAHGIAQQLAVSPLEVGKTIDLMEYRLVKCQLGLFGYSPAKKIVKAAEAVPDALHQLLQDAAIDEKIGCAACWGIAQALGIKKTAVSAACERLGIKIRPCQLGAF